MKKYWKYILCLIVAVIAVTFLLFHIQLRKDGVHTVLSQFHHIKVETDVYDENNRSIHINVDCYGRQTSNSLKILRNNHLEVDGIELEGIGAGILYDKEHGLYELFVVRLPEADANGELSHTYPYDDYFIYFDNRNVYVEITHHQNSREAATLNYEGVYNTENN